MAILGIDVGGTFTDAVLLEDGRLVTAKVPTARDQEESVIAAAQAVGARGVERFTHGTTVATNALLERKGTRTAFVTTEGFEHLLYLRRQARPHLYRPCRDHPPPLVPLDRCFGVRERISRDGVVLPLELDTLAGEIDAEAVAVCLLFAFRDPSHERQWPTSCGDGCRTRTWSPHTRWRPSSASTSARRRRPPTPTSGPSSRATCGARRPRAPKRACPSPW